MQRGALVQKVRQLKEHITLFEQKTIKLQLLKVKYKVSMADSYDIIVVGAGIAGLHVARELCRRGRRPLILEKYDYLGGRIVTLHKDIPKGPSLQWEIGAGRINKSHERVMAEVRRYGLTFVPISDESQFQAADGSDLQPNDFSELAATYLEPLRLLPASVKAQGTVSKLLAGAIGEEKAAQILSRFPYKAETTVMRADAALDSLLDPSGAAGDNFGVVAEGLSALVAGYAADCKAATFLLGHELIAADRTTNTLKVRSKDGVNTYTAPLIVYALHAKALKSIEGLKSMPILKDIIMCPLLRTYGYYKKPFFGPDKIVFGTNPVRHFIPVSANVAMISYTDAGDTGPWIHDADNNPDRLAKRLTTALRRTGVWSHVPEPDFFRAHAWHAGCSYWAPTTDGKTPEQLSREAVRLGLVGESFSAHHQTWIEGAIEHAEMFLKTIP